MPSYVAIEKFLNLANDIPVVDVRAPVEFHKAHIPNAINLPLFDDHQRAEIGTLYNQKGRIVSVLQGLQFVGPKMRCLAESLIQHSLDQKILIHCWRGGMRSRSVSWLAEQVDLQATVLQGGYKAYRRQVLNSFKAPLNLFVVSGLTGAGKTRQIEMLETMGEQTIDLERLANHRGSAFGGIGLQEQPAVEHFENLLFAKLQSLDRQRRIWVEDESRNVGSIKLPHHFFSQLRCAPAIFMEVSRTKRNELIRAEYGGAPSDQLIAAVDRIEKRLGGQNARQIIELLKSSKIETAVELLLDYYDRLYLSNKNRIKRDFYANLEVKDPFSDSTTRRLIELSNTCTAIPTR